MVHRSKHHKYFILLTDVRVSVIMNSYTNKFMNDFTFLACTHIHIHTMRWINSRLIYAKMKMTPTTHFNSIFKKYIYQ